MKINSFYGEPKRLQMGTAFEFSALFQGKMLYYRLPKPRAMYSSIEFQNIFPLVDAALWPLTKARCLPSRELARQRGPNLACAARLPLPAQELAENECIKKRFVFGTGQVIVLPL